MSFPPGLAFRKLLAATQADTTSFSKAAHASAVAHSAKLTKKSDPLITVVSAANEARKLLGIFFRFDMWLLPEIELPK
ncbi:MAG: hypothetical protein ACREV4_00265 [Gammaproteobacteria bacterium]